MMKRKRYEIIRYPIEINETKETKGNAYETETECKGTFSV